MGPLTRATPLKLFLDIVQSSSANRITCSCVDSRSDFLETTGDEMAPGNVIVYVLISFHSRDVPCTLSRPFVRPGFRLFCTRLAVYYLAVYSILF